MHCSKTFVVAWIASALFLSCSEPSAPTAGSPAALVIVGGNNQVGPVGAELPIPLVAKVVDSAGNPVKGQIVNFIVISGGGSVFAGAALSNDSGIVREQWTVGTSTTGAQEVDARALDPDNGQQIGIAVFTALAIAGPPTYFATVAGDSQRALMGDPLPESLAVILRDQYGNDVSDFTVTWTVLSGGGSITPSSITDAAGIAKAAWRMGNVGGAAEVGVTVGAVQPMVFHAEALVPLTAVAVSTGSQHSCAVTAGGQVYCWGANNAGQLGRPKATTLEPCYGYSPWPCSTRALLLPGSMTWTGVEAGASHSCGLVSGSAYCWGDNQFGELGIGSSGGDGFPPTAVTGGLSFVSVSAGFQVSCGLSSSGAASCWGTNRIGQLGTGLDTIADQPTSVAGGITLASVATSGSGGFTCGLAVDSTAYCWGNNLYGQLGDSSFLGDSATTPQRVAGGLRFTAITVGAWHACALTSTGAAYCWGSSAPLASSLPPQFCGSNACFPFPVPVNGAPSLVQISAGQDFTCGVTIDGAGYCWGGGGFPTAVPGGLQFSQIKVGTFHSCGVTRSSAVYCWGHNEEGQLGDGTFQSRVTPVRVIVQ